MCQCGCRGWCTLCPLLLCLAIDLLACAFGGYSCIPEELLLFGIDKDKYGVLGFILAIIEARADWPAWNEVVGVRSWSHGTYPCPKCDLPLHKMISAAYAGLVTIDSGPWEKYGHDQYLEDVKRSTIADSADFTSIHFSICLDT